MFVGHLRHLGKETRLKGHFSKLWDDDVAQVNQTKGTEIHDKVRKGERISIVHKKTLDNAHSSDEEARRTAKREKGLAVHSEFGRWVFSSLTKKLPKYADF